jgi:hypothetical protein
MARLGQGRVGERLGVAELGQNINPKPFAEFVEVIRINRMTRDRVMMSRHTGMVNNLFSNCRDAETELSNDRGAYFGMVND